MSLKIIKKVWKLHLYLVSNINIFILLDDIMFEDDDDEYYDKVMDEFENNKKSMKITPIFSVKH